MKKTMDRITTDELKEEFENHIEPGQCSEIEVIERGSVLFRIVPERQSLWKQAESFLNLLPPEAGIGMDPEERS